MARLHYLTHAFNLSNELVVERWVENPYSGEWRPEASVVIAAR